MPYSTLVPTHSVHSSKRNRIENISQVFRLPDQPICRAFPSFPTVTYIPYADIVAFVPGYGGGSATDFNRLPCSPKEKNYRRAVSKSSAFRGIISWCNGRFENRP